MPTLYIMRHDKAENTSPDIKRHLSDVGKKNVQATASLLRDKNTKIEHVLYSPAYRAKETALLMCDGLGIAAINQKEDARIYNASVSDLNTVLSEIDESLVSILLVGHIPGLIDLVLSLSGESIGMSAGNIAVVSAGSWDDVRQGKCRLLEKIVLIR